MNDALHFMHRIVLPYKPRAILVYEGDNDVAQGIAPRMIANTFGKFVQEVHKDLPHCRIYFLSIKPSISRWSMWSTMTQANGLIAAACARDKRLTYLDIASCMLGEDGTPKPDIFKEDKLHMTRDGYILWRDAVSPILVAAELSYESKKDADADKERTGR
jgi:lysophospholipase L1-like esterase